MLTLGHFYRFQTNLISNWGDAEVREAEQETNFSKWKRIFGGKCASLNERPVYINISHIYFMKNFTFIRWKWVGPNEHFFSKYFLILVNKNQSSNLHFPSP